MATYLSPGKYRVTLASDTFTTQIWNSIDSLLPNLNSTVTLSKKYFGNSASINLGSGSSDSLILGVAGDWKLSLQGVETISASQADTRLISFGTLNIQTDGSISEIRSGMGNDTVTYTGAVRDTKVTTQGGADIIRFDSTSTKWQGKKEGGVVYVYDLNTGYRVELDSSVEFAQVIDTTDTTYDTSNQGQDDDPNTNWVNGLVDLSTLEDGDTFGASLSDAINNNIVFLSDRIEITATFGGFAAAYGTTSTGQQNNQYYWGNWYYSGYDLSRYDVNDPNTKFGYVMLGEQTDPFDTNRPNTAVLQLEPSTEKFNGQGSAVPLDGFTWAYFFSGNQNYWEGLTVAGTRLIIGTDAADTGGAMDQSTDTLDSLYGSWWATDNYAIYGFGGNDVIVAGAGNDTVWGGAGADTITGGDGVDNLNGEGGDDVFAYSALADFVVSGAVKDSIDGGTGTDRIVINAALTLTTSDSLARLTAVEVLASGSQAAGATGRAHSIVIDTNTKLDSITTIDLSADAATASTGVVNLTGVTNATAILGVSAGQNTITGGAGNDTITGGAGADAITAGNGDDTINGFAGADTVTGGAGTDTIVLTATAAALNSATNDQIVTVEAVSASGAAEGVTIDLSLQTEGFTITGSAHNDTITGGAGADEMTGGAGADTFVFAAGDSGITVATADTIMDFTTADDFISTGIAGIAAADVVIADGTALVDFNAFVTAAEAAFAAGDSVYVAWNVANISVGNALVAINNNGGATFTAGDSLIVLTGVNTAAEIAVANFIA